VSNGLDQTVLLEATMALLDALDADPTELRT